MGALQRFEKRLETLVSGAFARAFKSEVQPVEIAAALQREMDNRAQILTRERRLVPNRFTVELSTIDHGRLSEFESTLLPELAQLVHEHAAVQRYTFTGPVELELEQHEDLATGQYRVRSAVKAGTDRHEQYAAATDAAERHAVATLEVNGLSYPLIPPGIVLGRGTDADLRIDDPGVSRRHAEIRVGSDGTSLLLVDLGSTNGTIVDGVTTTEAALVDGSRVTLGATVLVVHRAEAAAGPERRGRN